jgi:bifunctional UDP-N-acetylglucosamine pyrophosphorylase / glucosamine-1-phosphate N-acetyltransferase
LTCFACATLKLTTVILAAGRGARMRSALPKVLHPLAGRPLLSHVLAAARALSHNNVNNEVYVVYGHGGAQVKAAFAHESNIHWIEQTEQLGTGHAVAQVLPHLADPSLVLVLYGDVPLISPDTLHLLVQTANHHTLALLTTELDNPTGYGRIVRDVNGCVMRIIEEKEASDVIRQINEVNTGILAVPAAHLRRWLTQIRNNNAQNEYYLTDIIALAVNEQIAVKTLTTQKIQEVLGINDRVQLAALERYYQLQQVEQLMLQGVTVLDPARLDIRGTVELTGQDVLIDVNVILSGRNRLGARVRIGAHCVLHNVTLADDVEILPHSVLEDAVIGQGSVIGPFARLRTGTVLAEQVKIGNFVETKKVNVGYGSKINHLSYIGDSEIGQKVNIGAGTITCNYDGVNKHKTVIGDGAFIGSDTQLVAPVTVGAGATIGAGSTITKDAPAQQLTLSRNRQMSFDRWQRPEKKSS